LAINLRPREDEILRGADGKGEVRIQISGKHGGDFRLVRIYVHADLLILQGPEPFPGTVFVGKGTGKVAGEVVGLAAFFHGVGIGKRSGGVLAGAVELGSLDGVGALDTAIDGRPVLGHTRALRRLTQRRETSASEPPKTAKRLWNCHQ
jgi:hypothetical protein